MSVFILGNARARIRQNAILSVGAAIVLALTALPASANAAGAIDWLLTPLSGATEHTIAATTAWHGRIMVFAWAFLMPAALVVARFFKITPRQRWPQYLDNPFWFITHRRLGYAVVILMTLALGIMLWGSSIGFAPWRSFHTTLGWLVVVLAWLQVLGAHLRGTHGGPVNPFTRQPKPVAEWPGDHFSMTRKRIVFEYVHKSLGYVLVVLAVLGIDSGLRAADAPRWMWLTISAWWVLCAVAFAVMQRRVHSIDTYQAIWGLDRALPGYRRPPIGIGITRYTEADAGTAPWQKPPRP